MQFSDLPHITGGKILQLKSDLAIENLVIDSRKAVIDDGSIFFAINGPRNDGHLFITELYSLGIRQFVVEKELNLAPLPNANIIWVNSSINALNSIAKNHRAQFSIPVIGITGSNGKTIIKEWLYQLLSVDKKIVKNPGSYNSQIGVPLSVWEMQPYHQMGIFEAGISQPGEMIFLQKLIQPNIGIFTNIGSAHAEGFQNIDEKIKEKLKLFSQSEILIYCTDHVAVDRAVHETKLPSFTWGTKESADIKLTELKTTTEFYFRGKSYSILFPFHDKASLENGFHCVALLLHLGYDVSTIQQRISGLKSIAMRMELKEGINNCQIIDDSYNNDLSGLQISLDFLSGQQKKKKTVILSSILQAGISDEETVKKIVSMLNKTSVTKFVGIGSAFSAFKNLFESVPLKYFYDFTEEFLSQYDFDQLEGEVILVKGARIFQFEKIVHRLQRKAHGTVMQIDLGKIVHNLNFFKSKLKPKVKIMAMVKAFAYGSGSEEVASLLQYHKVDYLGVAYTDEGVDLRKKNISLPIMVMNPSEESFDLLLANQLEPAIYSLKMLHLYANFLAGKNAKIHVEIETGMQRLGIGEVELDEALKVLKLNKNISVASVFSHLSASDEAKHDGFSKEQFERFQKSYKKISSELNIEPLRHILNSAGILRLPDFQMEMVRLGIGLYGIDPASEVSDKLEPVATLKTVISQIKKIHAGETIGYGRKGVAEKELTIATIAIGYADGFSRSFSRGKGVVLVNGKRAPVIGNVCMDMTMINITGINANEGDEVIVFGEGLPIQEVAETIDTIPYEILTNTSARVKRVFVTESI
ncbi:MAG TPA: bifunctional UDP-N-acetylmuramoyl-tripeptide:D-alanyl-D-alanine ligase/alanine racemase [Cytophagales bacterium]|jgi:Alr-MurF fusion protein|nr:bifunctional UDP-N-acetylmuramoyl-tripeptide:D-alanyl-D-alanine ligase/alanine racemase [Cytophagales bacterium]